MTNDGCEGFTDDQVFRLEKEAFERGYRFGINEVVEEFEVIISNLKSKSQELFGNESNGENK